MYLHNVQLSDAVIVYKHQESRLDNFDLNLLGRYRHYNLKMDLHCLKLQRIGEHEALFP